MLMTTTVLLTLFLLQACHWAADFTHLSTPWMLGAKAKGTPLWPIAVHAGVHAVLMAFVVGALGWGLLAMGGIFMVEWGTHFLIDVGKGRLQAAYPALSQSQNPYHWWLFGLDQWLHQAVIVGMVYGLVNWV